MLGLLARLQSLKVLLGTDSPEVRGWAPVVQQGAQATVNAAIAELKAECENHTQLLHAYHQACVDAANRANAIDRLQQVWEDTRTQRDELLAHIAGKAPLPKWAADWLKL